MWKTTRIDDKYLTLKDAYDSDIKIIVDGDRKTAYQTMTIKNITTNEEKNLVSVEVTS